MKKFVTRIKRLIKYLIVSLKILYSSNKVINKKCNSSINKSWIEGVYKLQFLKYVRVRPLYRDNELFIFYKGSIFISVVKEKIFGYQNTNGRYYVLIG